MYSFRSSPHGLSNPLPEDVGTEYLDAPPARTRLSLRPRRKVMTYAESNPEEAETEVEDEGVELDEDRYQQPMLRRGAPAVDSNGEEVEDEDMVDDAGESDKENIADDQYEKTEGSDEGMAISLAGDSEEMPIDLTSDDGSEEDLGNLIFSAKSSPSPVKPARNPEAPPTLLEAFNIQKDEEEARDADTKVIHHNMFADHGGSTLPSGSYTAAPPKAFSDMRPSTSPPPTSGETPIPGAPRKQRFPRPPHPSTRRGYYHHNDVFGPASTTNGNGMFTSKFGVPALINPTPAMTLSEMNKPAPSNLVVGIGNPIVIKEWKGKKYGVPRDVTDPLRYIHTIIEKIYAPQIFTGGFPPELLQNVVRFLPGDLDVLAFKLICKNTSTLVGPSVWFKRYIRTFDGGLDEHAVVKVTKEGIEELVQERKMTVEMLADLYKVRKGIQYTSLGVWFGRNRTRGCATWVSKPKLPCLGLLRELIIESNAQTEEDADGNKVVFGLNLQFIKDWVTFHGTRRKWSDILDETLSTVHTDTSFWDPRVIVTAARNDALVLVIQVCLAPLMMQPEMNKGTPATQFGVTGIDIAQREAYTDSAKQPIFLGQWKSELNVRYVLSVLHFFRYHLNSTTEGVFVDEYAQLQKHEMPQFWTGKLKDGTQRIGTHWKGVSTWINEKDLVHFRQKEDDEVFTDDHDPLLDMTLFFEEEAAFEWPASIEEIIESNPYPPMSTSPTPTRRSTRKSSPASAAKQYDLKQFSGMSREDRPNQSYIYGRLHAIPQQQGIPGFQRLSMIKFHPNKLGEHNIDTPLDNPVWEYEGCVLPGGRIIVGRWHRAYLNGYIPDAIEEISGPFMFWNVDNDVSWPPVESVEALKYLEYLQEYGIVF